jgi:hypothetical protein
VGFRPSGTGRGGRDAGRDGMASRLRAALAADGVTPVSPATWLQPLAQSSALTATHAMCFVPVFPMTAAQSISGPQAGQGNFPFSRPDAGGTVKFKSGEVRKNAFSGGSAGKGVNPIIGYY